MFFYFLWKAMKWQFPFCWWPRNDFSNVFQTWLPHPFLIMNREYIAYFVLFYPYIYIRSIIWIIWSIPLLSIIYSKSHLGILSEDIRKIMSWLTVIFRKKHFWNDLGKFLYDSIWLNMMYNLLKWCLKPFTCILSH